MVFTDLTEPGEIFNSIEQNDRLALGKSFRPFDESDSLATERFVGDFVKLMPTEIVDIIFTCCEPEDNFKLRNVSKTWNNYLTRPGLLNQMERKINASGGQYLSDSDVIWAERRTFEERVRNRCALVNGRACSFELIQHHPDCAVFFLYCSGTLISWWDDIQKIYVRWLYKNDTEWHKLESDDPDDVFYDVRLTSNHILAYTDRGQVYCWNSSTLDLLAKFWLTTIPEMMFDGPDDFEEFEMDAMDQPKYIDASSNTIVLRSGHGWYLYALVTKTLTIAYPALYKHRSFFTRKEIRVEQSGYIYVSYGLSIVDVFKINDTSTSIDFVHRIDLESLSNQQLASLAVNRDREAVERLNDSIEVVVVFNHQCFLKTYVHMSDSSGPALRLVFELRDGVIVYHHSILHKGHLPNWIIYYPQWHQTFSVDEFQPGRSFDLYQIHDKKFRFVSVGQEKERSNDELKASLPADMTEEKVGVFRRHVLLIAGDSDFVVVTPGEADFTQVWRFSGLDKSRPAAES